MGPNNWGIFLILPVTTGVGIGLDGEISPVVCMFKNGLPLNNLKSCLYGIGLALLRVLALSAKILLPGLISLENMFCLYESRAGSQKPRYRY